MGLVKRNIAVTESVALPFVYALLSSKETIQYRTVLEAIPTVSDEVFIPNLTPKKIISDFEKAIINACTEVFPEAKITCCFFHLGQNIYRKIQAEGLQEAYNNADNRYIKKFSHMLLGLAFQLMTKKMRLEYLTFNPLRK